MNRYESVNGCPGRAPLPSCFPPAMAWSWPHHQSPIASIPRVQVKIVARRAHLERVREALSGAIHRALQETLGPSSDKRYHRFLPFDDGDFLHPPDRGESYTILELVCRRTQRGNQARLPAPPDG
jgi:hypothetical protein